MLIEFDGFEWDRGNWDKNLRKHEVTREESEEAFFGNSFIYSDERHSTDTEKRYVLFGETAKGRPLFIAFTTRQEKIRIVSARSMSQKERSWYDEEKKKNRF